jgi:hypothetical protein
MYGEVEWPERQQLVQFAGTCCKQFQFLERIQISPYPLDTSKTTQKGAFAAICNKLCNNTSASSRHVSAYTLAYDQIAINLYCNIVSNRTKERDCSKDCSKDSSVIFFCSKVNCIATDTTVLPLGQSHILPPPRTEPFPPPHPLYGPAMSDTACPWYHMSIFHPPSASEGAICGSFRRQSVS